MAARILISVSARGNSSFYETAVERAGGVPVARYAPRSADGFDGLLLAGGADVAPRFYGRENLGSRGIDEIRDEAEFRLLSQAAEAGLPVLGICRGMQVINVWAGGTLAQDISGHRDGDGFTEHEITADGVLKTLYGGRFICNSSHHQAVDTVGKGFRITAWCGKVPEAMRHASLPVCAVQFHPERMEDGDILFRWWIERVKQCSGIS